MAAVTYGSDTPVRSNRHPRDADGDTTFQVPLHPKKEVMGMAKALAVLDRPALHSLDNMRCCYAALNPVKRCKCVCNCASGPMSHLVGMCACTPFPKVEHDAVVFVTNTKGYLYHHKMVPAVI